LIEGSDRAGRGVAYSTTEPAHLLNVRAEGMSAWAGEPDHFAQRFAAEGGDPRGFAQRRLFGGYLLEILDEAVASGGVTIVHGAAIGAERADGLWRLQLEDGSTIHAAAIALATGNQEPEALRAFSGIGERFIANPWGAEARAAVNELAADDGNALIIGTGLTMVDLVLSLDAAGFGGEIVAVSRRGLIPRAHADYTPVPVEAHEIPRGRVRSILRWLRRRAAEIGWRAALDSLRPHSHSLWQGLDASEQQRFLRHARPWWDVHRHRIAPEVAAVVQRLASQGRLRVMAARIVAAREIHDAIEVDLRRRGEDGTKSMSFAYAFNCTGPLHAVERTRDPLLRTLFDRRAVRPDHLGIGLEVDESSRVGERLWALGPLTKGRFWEIIAVPDIREQAAIVADSIARELQE
jgi:uncharacterized NAD(P)/FAD-binding protein YdhS